MQSPWLPEALDFYAVFIKLQKISRFNNLVKNVQNEGKSERKLNICKYIKYKKTRISFFVCVTSLLVRTKKVS